MKHEIAIKWIYAAKEDQDGTRILVDPVSPHSRELHDLNIDSWCQHAAPSSGLKRQLVKGELDWKSFTQAYREEIHLQPQKLTQLLDAASQGKLTLLTVEREPEHTWLALLKDLLETRLKSNMFNLSPE
ncbi:DUF488 domain-containing protein [Marinospirillum insulare]|uniref:Uncharacterized protein n=1 Tax=Marinospirillum insulare TaxID=217169 RepID=A0ABQ5ZU96_9GAMM|nr:DUF488 family protein [Marinospirillum insulare]GLR62608.1 hypothetical protein GCM10007878_00430 [Marinospirillum insulare]